MDRLVSKSNLSVPECRLVELLQALNFGRIENLQVRGGVPILDPSPLIIRAQKMGSGQSPREEAALQDFWLKTPVVDLIQTIRNIRDGEVLSITVQHGLPYIVETRHEVQR